MIYFFLGAAFLAAGFFTAFFGLGAFGFLGVFAFFSFLGAFGFLAAFLGVFLAAGLAAFFTFFAAGFFAFLTGFSAFLAADSLKDPLAPLPLVWIRAPLVTADLRNFLMNGASLSTSTL